MNPCGKTCRGNAGKALLAVFVSLAVILAPGLTARAAAQAAPAAVRVGYFYNGDFMHRADDGSYEGYDVEYYYMLAGYADWDIRFVAYENLNDALAALERGEIDVMSGLSRTSERAAKYLISAKKMCTAQIAVQTRADDDRFSVGDTDSMKNMTCGILRGSNVVTLYRDWCGENGLTPRIVEYGSLNERDEALFSGKVDAIAGGSTIPGAQKIAEFPSLDLFFMFHRGRADLKSQLDRAMNILTLENPGYANSLFLKYFPASRNTVPSFSRQEKAYLKEHPSIPVGVFENDAPFSQKNPDGSVGGILPEYYAHLSQVTGVEFVCMPYADSDSVLAALRRGEIALIGNFDNDIFEADEKQLLLTVPFLKTNMVQITRAGANAAASFAVPQCNAALAETVLSAQNAGDSVRICGNSEECFALLRQSKIDSVICTQPAATWLLSRNRASDYMVLAFGSEPWNAVCALPYGESGNTLRSVLNKSITADGGYIDQLITSETLRDSGTLATFFDRLPVSLLAGAVVVAAVLLGIAAAALIVLLRRRKAEQLLAQRQAALAAAEDASRAKHAFFGAVSHDMRTPLNGIMGYTNLALAADTPEKARDYLVKIQKSGAVLCSLVNDTLAVSRMESEKFRLEPAPVATAELLEEVLEPVRALAAEKGVQLEESTDQARPRQVLADRVNLQKILLNLLTNAIRFTPPGGTVSFRCRLDPPAGGKPESIITIADTGAGISREFLPRLFEPFAQEHPENADASGSGMGLAIVKRIVDAMGGTIEVESELGRGTTFTVRLRLEELDVPGGAGERKDPGDEGALRGKRALVCEDNTLNMEILCAVLTGCGMEVACADNGRACLDAYAASTVNWFDVVLMDLRMPIMDGITAARAIRALDRPDAKRVPILAVSADAFEEDVEKCREAGMDGHIAKPVVPAQLFAELKHILTA